jgi:dephospho-CoA kinase
MEFADYSIDNNGTFDSLYKQIDGIVEKIRHQ